MMGGEWKLADKVVGALLSLATALLLYQTAQINSLQREVVELKVAAAKSEASPRVNPTEILAIYSAIGTAQQNAVRMQSAIEYNTKQIDEMQKRLAKP
jgi:hypothetical protein